MIQKKFGKDFWSEGGALTLHYSTVSDTNESSNYNILSKTHSSGWTIKGEVREDYYVWVNDFEAEHPKYGKVYGDFEETVYADSEEGFNHFYKNHEPNAWDYGDI